MTRKAASSIFTLAAICAAQANGWTLDLRDDYDQSHSIYIKAGESLRVLLDGQGGTGYRWMSNYQYAKMHHEDVVVSDDQLSTSHIDFQKENVLEDDPNFFNSDLEDGEKFLPMGSALTYEQVFHTEAGADFEEEIMFTFNRPWLLSEFPKSIQDSEGQFTQINVVAKANFAQDLRCDTFNLDQLPGQIDLFEGALIRLVIRENPTTGYWWHSNASRSQNAPIRQIYSGFEVPNTHLIGASGKRILVFQVNDLDAELKLGLTRPGDLAEDYDWDSSEDNLSDHLFIKSISFAASQDSDVAIQQ